MSYYHLKCVCGILFSQSHFFIHKIRIWQFFLFVRIKDNVKSLQSLTYHVQLLYPIDDILAI